MVISLVQKLLIIAIYLNRCSFFFTPVLHLCVILYFITLFSFTINT